MFLFTLEFPQESPQKSPQFQAKKIVTVSHPFVTANRAAVFFCRQHVPLFVQRSSHRRMRR